MAELIWKGDGFLNEGGERVPSGERFNVSDERAAQLHVLLGALVADPGAADLLSLKRDELNDAAAEAGVEAPEALPNKAAVVAAISAVDTTQEPTPEKED